MSSKTEVKFYLPSGVPMHFVIIPAGTFLMGVNTNDEHKVKLEKSFMLGKFPVTRIQAWPTKEEAESLPDANLPVSQISHDQAQNYCDNLSEYFNKKVRLPTEAEWEYACRAGTTTKYAFGDDITTDQAHFYENSGQPFLMPVGNFPPNAWGLHDMHGNVWEWCADNYRAKLKNWWIEDDKIDVNPLVKSDIKHKRIAGGFSFVVRGGCGKAAKSCCSSDYRSARKSHENYDCGFRLVVELD